MKKVNLAIVGATGQVGRAMLEILTELDFPIANLRLFASSRSAGEVLHFENSFCKGDFQVEDLKLQDSISLKGINIALFSAGGSTSKEFSPVFAKAGAVVVDNSSAWRKDSEVPLIVAEVNPEDVELAFQNKRIIANPNCTTMAAMPVLKPLNDSKKLKKLIVSTYQAVSGMGVQGVSELAMQTDAAVKQDAKKLAFDGSAIDFPLVNKFPDNIAFNVIPYAGNLVDDGLLETDEEQKLRNESRKILHLPELRVQGTCVRVPVFTGHSLNIQAEFEEDITPKEAIKLMREFSESEQGSGSIQVLGTANPADVKSSLVDLAGSGVEVSGAGARAGKAVAGVPTPQLAAGKNPSFVGRIRQDYSLENADPSILKDGIKQNLKGLSLFISCDNLRKGAALNTIQIAKLLVERVGTDV